MKAIILARGKGTRLEPYTHILPKPLVPIGDVPILEVILHQMKRYGITDVTLTVGHLAHLIESFFQDGSKYGINLKYSYEDEPLGTAGPLSLIKGLDKTFLVTNGDVLTTLDLRNFIEFHHQNGGCTTIAMYERNVQVNLGVIHLDGGNKVSGYVEKPILDYSVSMGIYVFEPKVLEYIPKGKYLDFPDLVNLLLSKGEHVVGYPYEGYWQDLGRSEDYRQAVDDFERLKPEIFGDN